MSMAQDTTQQSGDGTRSPAMDLYRVGALLLVVVGHWAAASLTFRDGGFWRENPLVELPWTQWLTLLFQVVPVFFVVAGYAGAVSWTRRGHAGRAARPDWLRRRLRRPLGPTALYVGVVLAVVAALSWAGAGGSDLEFAGWAVAMHLWFLGTYVLVVAATPVAMAAQRRWGPAVPVAMTVAVAGLDVLTLAAHVPYLGWLNYLLPWAVLYQVGIAWQAGSLRRPHALALAAGSAVLLGLLVTVGPYPVSMIGIPGAAVDNTGPPNLALLALGGVQAGLVLALAAPLDRLLAPARRRRILAVANDNVLPLYLWHMVPLVAVALVGYPAGLLPQPELGSADWWLFRLGWVAMLAVVAAGQMLLLWWGRRFFAAPLPIVRIERGWPRRGAAALLAGVLAVAVALTAFATVGFAPEGRFPAVLTGVFAAGVVLVALTPAGGQDPGLTSARRKNVRLAGRSASRRMK